MKQIEHLIRIIRNSHRILIMIDGRCGAGKTTLANLLQNHLEIPVIHLDDYYLPFIKRDTAAKESTMPNVDHIRFINEVLQPYQAQEPIIYRRYQCHEDTFYEPIEIGTCPKLIIEGSYSHHPFFQMENSYRVFVNVEQGLQLSRLKQRNEEVFPMFVSTWIPMEEAYFDHFSIMDTSDIVIDTTNNDIIKG